MKKLCLLIGNLCGGGAEKVAVHIANGMAAPGLKVQLVLFDKEGIFLDLLSDEVEVVDLESHGHFSRSALSFLRYLWHERPDAILSFMGPSNMLAVAANLLTGWRARVVITEHCAFSMDRYAVNPLFNRMVKGLLAMFLYPMAHTIVAVSDYGARDLERYAGYREGRVRTIYNPVVTPQLMQARREVVNHPWVDENYQLILNVGRLTPQKNIPLLIRAFAKLHQTQQDARLIIMGEGESRHDIEHLVASLGLQDYIELPGFVANPYAYMQHANLFVSSSDWEGLPNVMVEALAIGLPVVATDCKGGSGELLQGGLYGTLVPAGDEDALAEAMKNALLQQDEGRQQARSFRHGPMEKFTVDYALKAYLGVLFD